MSLHNQYSNTSGLKLKNIFISYRVKDTSAEAGRLADSLKQYFYEEQIFMDIDKLEPGIDFTKVISKSLEGCDVMLAIIGNDWVGKKADGTNRICEENDWVRLEIATALERNIRVVPLLVDGAQMPEQNELPKELHPLMHRQAYEVSNKRWKYDTENIAAFLEKSLSIPRKKTFTPVNKSTSSPIGNVVKWGLVGLGALFVILVIIYAILDSNKNGTQTTPIDQTQRQQPINGDPSTPVNGNTNQQPENKSYENADIHGIWDDAAGLYYLSINQDGDQPEITSYSLAGQKTGEGFGVLKGDDFSFKINIINFGIISAKGKVSADESTIRGTTTVESNGAIYNEPMTLIRR